MKQLSLFIVLLMNACLLQAQDYRNYHRQIIRAEELIFVQEQFDKGLDLYRKTFQEYDFVFAHDCITALEIAVFRKDTTAFLDIARKGFANGILPRHLKGIYYISSSKVYQHCKDSLIPIFRTQRPHYLDRIRQHLPQLKKLIDLYAMDQLVKNNYSWESNLQSDVRYKKQIAEKIAVLKPMLAQYGFLSDKLVGIGQNDIMQELKTGSPDMPAYYVHYKYDKQYTIKDYLFEFDEYNFCSYLSLVLLVHYIGDYHYPKLYDSTYYATQIIEGNMHPKEFGKLMEWRYTVGTRPDTPNVAKGDLYFALGLSVTYPPELVTLPTVLPDTIIDACRKEYFMPPIEQDRKKWRFMMTHKMYFGWGLHGTRS